MVSLSMAATNSTESSPLGPAPFERATPPVPPARLTLGYDCIPVIVQKTSTGGWLVLANELKVVPCGKTGILDTNDGDRTEVLVVFGEVLDHGVELSLKRIGERRRRSGHSPRSISNMWAATSLIVGLAVGAQLPISQWLAWLTK